MAEIYVTSTADSGAGSLRQAIADANDGDVILFDSDVFPVGQTTSILLSSYIGINKSVSIYGGEADGNGGYTSGATKRFYVYREVEGVKTKVYITDETPALGGETVLFENVCRASLDAQNAGRCVRTGNIASASGHCVISGLELKNGYAATSGGGALFAQNAMSFGLYDCAIVGANTDAGGGGIYIGSVATTNIIDACAFNSCAAAQNGGGVLLSSSSKNTLNGCTFDGCSSANGGAIDAASTSQNALNGCIFYGCVATIGGGGIYLTSTSINTLNACSFVVCTATSGGGFYAASTSDNTLNGCNFDASSTVYVANTSAVVISGGITTIASAAFNAATITIDNGAALTITTSAATGAATFTSAGRGYLAIGANVSVSSATLTNVVLCAYGANVSSFAEVDGVLEWEAANPSTTVLIERADGDSWSTVAQPTGESLTLYLPPSDTVRLFDGVQFFVAQAPEQRTYYYIGGAEGSFTSAADWSLRRGGVAITEPPVVAGQRFIVGDIAEDAQEE